MSRLITWIAIGAVLAAAACTRVPEIEDKLTMDLRHADYPQLQPLDQVFTPRPAPEDESEALQQELEARSARLQNRADALRNAPIE